jgi:hypothetical protein
MSIFPAPSYVYVVTPTSASQTTVLFFAHDICIRFKYRSNSCGFLKVAALQVVLSLILAILHLRW